MNIRTKKVGDFIIISPYSFTPTHPKSYPYWIQLIPLLKTLNYKLIQIGTFGEQVLQNVDDVMYGLSFEKLQQKLSDCYSWISVDNFLPHMCNCMSLVTPGIAIFGLSDPNIFGYSYNKNILKSKSFLRVNQFDVWTNTKQNVNAFNTADELFPIIENFLKE